MSTEGWRKEWGGVDETARWLRTALEPPKPGLHCIFHTKLVIRGTLTPTGTRYVAMPGQVIPVEPEDVETLLAMTSKPTGCTGCHGNVQQAERHYFEEV